MNVTQTTKHTAFIAGATGYTGKALVRELLSRGVDVHAHIRPGSSSLPDAKHAFEEQGAHVDLTPWEADEMAATLGELQPTHVFFVIGTTKKRMKQEPGDSSYEAVDYGLAKLLLDACSACESEPVFVYLSAQGVSEGASTAYYRARWRAEEAVRDSGLSYVIARPGFISGSDRDESRPMERLGSVCRLGDCVGGGRDRCELGQRQTPAPRRCGDGEPACRGRTRPHIP